MARFQIASLGVGSFLDRFGNPQAGVPFTLSGGSLHAAASGGTVLSGASLVSGSDGSVPGWLDPDTSPGVYTITAAGANPVVFQVAPSPLAPYEMTFVGPESRAASALQGDVTATYAFPASALNGSGNSVMSGTSARVVGAYFRVTWTPNATGCGVRLVAWDPGPTNIVQLAEITNNGSTSPLNDGITVDPTLVQAIFDVTAAATVGTTAVKSFGYQIKGNGAVGPLMYTVKLQLLLRL